MRRGHCFPWNSSPPKEARYLEILQSGVLLCPSAVVAHRSCQTSLGFAFLLTAYRGPPEQGGPIHRGQKQARDALSLASAAVVTGIAPTKNRSSRCSFSSFY